MSMKVSGIFLSLFALSVFFMAFCNNKGSINAANDNSGKTIQWKELLSGQGSSIVTDSQVVCTSSASFDKIWEAAFNDYPGQYEKPAVDFTKNFVICCFRGNVKSAGYAVKVRDVESTDDKLKVTIEYSEPGPGCMNASVIETPFTIISIAGKMNLKPEYIKEKNITKCD